MGNTNLLLTNLFYRPISDISFNDAKATFFEKQLVGYSQKSFQDKWSWLKNAFFGLILDQNSKDVVADFMDKRQSSTNNKYVLSRDKCIDYIERFYFLYQNIDPTFKLNHDAKASLLYLLEDAMTNSQLCELGRYIRFESIKPLI
ncbi:MAG: hypothetical protein P1U74_07350 [Legionellaceae bacterium]|nr:hypothetical protein [Legionellaceae bacterium]